MAPPTNKEPVLVQRVIQPSPQEIDHLVHTLRSAYRGDAYIAALTAGRQNLESLLFRSQVQQGIAYGQVYAAGAGGRIQGVLIVFGPGEQPPDLCEDYVSQLPNEMQYWWTHHLVLKFRELWQVSYGSVDVVLNSWQIRTLGVVPDYRRRGIASALIDVVIQKASPQRQVLVVDVHTDQLVRFFRRFGFQTRGAKNITSYQGGVPLFSLIREPKPLPPPLRLHAASGSSNANGR